jgi:hypothetical protein
MAAQNPTASELLPIALSGNENFVPAAEEASQAAPHKFLSLAPTLSASYPTRVTKAAAPSPAQTPVSEKSDALAIALEENAKSRRSSSLSSNGSVMKRRFLKLGPVHYGNGDGDWSEDVLE